MAFRRHLAPSLRQFLSRRFCPVRQRDSVVDERLGLRAALELRGPPNGYRWPIAGPLGDLNGDEAVTVVIGDCRR